MTHDCLPLRLGAFDRVHEGTKCRWAPHSSSHLCTPEKFDRGAEAAVTMRNPDFCYELDDFMLLGPSHRPTHHSDTLRLYARAIHDTCACLAPMASRRCSSLCFQVRGLTKKKVLGVDRPRVVHYTSALCVLDTTSYLRGRPASRSSSNLDWKDIARYRAFLEAAW